MKIVFGITTFLILVAAVWLYLNRELCGQYPWWIALICVLMTVIAYLFLLFLPARVQY